MEQNQMRQRIFIFFGGEKLKKILGPIAIPAVVLLGYFILYNFFILGYGSAAIHARKKLCFNNQRELQDAVSLFDLDAKSSNNEIIDLFPAMGK